MWCAACATRTAAPASPSSVLLIASGGETIPATSPPQLNWVGPAPRTGTKVALFTPKGYAGLVRILGLVPNESERVRVELLDGEIPGNFQTLGPVSGALEKLKMQEGEGEGEVYPATWRVALVVDLDGDGRRDLEHVLRCNAYQPSGCNARVCSEVCTGTRRVGESEPARETIACTSFIPDNEDCDPK
jgi:hypothetical protein